MRAIPALQGLIPVPILMLLLCTIRYLSPIRGDLAAKAGMIHAPKAWNGQREAVALIFSQA